MGRKRYPDEKKPTGFLKPLHFKNDIQEMYADTLLDSTITFCLGPAGTGKTFIATHIALQHLLDHDVDKIILTRPIVAVEDIGYLPGDMNEKIHPYMLPLFDALEDHVGPTKAKEMLESGKVSVVPLAFMRGRSLNRSFIILDEAQNTTPEQMKMFLTRIGYDSKMSINGDLAQSDLPKHICPINGLQYAAERLRGCDPQINMVEFAQRHIVRNPLIGAMLSRMEGPADVTMSAHDRESARASKSAPARHGFHKASLFTPAE